MKTVKRGRRERTVSAALALATGAFVSFPGSATADKTQPQMPGARMRLPGRRAPGIRAGTQAPGVRILPQPQGTSEAVGPPCAPREQQQLKEAQPTTSAPGIRMLPTPQLPQK